MFGKITSPVAPKDQMSIITLFSFFYFIYFPSLFLNCSHLLSSLSSSSSQPHRLHQSARPLVALAAHILHSSLPLASRAVCPARLPHRPPMSSYPPWRSSGLRSRSARRGRSGKDDTRDGGTGWDTQSVTVDLKKKPDVLIYAPGSSLHTYEGRHKWIYQIQCSKCNNGEYMTLLHSE